MIQDKECNTVYIAEYLQVMFPKMVSELKTILGKYGYEPKFIPTTDNTLVGKRLSIWVRDYMPIQRNLNDHILFDYQPDYLVNTKIYGPHIPDGKRVLTLTGMNALDFTKGNLTFPEGLNIDGGNMLRCGDYIVMTDKIFDENPTWRQQDIVEKLTNIFGKTLIFMPWDKREYCGHTDGILRYLGNNKVLLNTYSLSKYGSLDKWYMERFRKRLQPYFGKENIKELKFEDDNPAGYRWAYVNWLQLENVLIIPKFGVPEDEEVLRQLEEFMPDYKGKIEQLMMSREYNENGKDLNLADLGGCLNCASWTIKE